MKDLDALRVKTFYIKFEIEQEKGKPTKVIETNICQATLSQLIMFIDRVSDVDSFKDFIYDLLNQNSKIISRKEIEMIDEKNLEVIMKYFIKNFAKGFIDEKSLKDAKKGDKKKLQAR